MTDFRFIHSSDLHLGRRFGNLPEDIRGRLVEARHAVIKSLSVTARNHGASHVLIAGDLFDTETPSDQVWRLPRIFECALPNLLPGLQGVHAVDFAELDELKFRYLYLTPRRQV